jgi:hypothetical protein
MSSSQRQILSAIDARVQVVLPTYELLKFSYDLEANDYRGSETAYGVTVGGGNSVEGTHKSITMDQNFGVVLTARFGGRAKDIAEREALNIIYDNLELLYVDFFQSKLGLNAVVYLVNALELDEPEKIADNIISVKMNFTVKFRKQT